MHDLQGRPVGERMTTRIEEWRRARGWSQQEFATRAGVSRKTIATALRRGVAAPGTLVKIADALGVTPERLLLGPVENGQPERPFVPVPIVDLAELDQAEAAATSKAVARVDRGLIASVFLRHCGMLLDAAAPGRFVGAMVDETGYPPSGCLLLVDLEPQAVTLQGMVVVARVDGRLAVGRCYLVGDAAVLFPVTGFADPKAPVPIPGRASILGVVVCQSRPIPQER